MRIYRAYGVFEVNELGEYNLVALFTTRREAEVFCVLPKWIVKKLKIPIFD